MGAQGDETTIIQCMVLLFLKHMYRQSVKILPVLYKRNLHIVGPESKPRNSDFYKKLFVNAGIPNAWRTFCQILEALDQLDTLGILENYRLFF